MNEFPNLAAIPWPDATAFAVLLALVGLICWLALGNDDGDYPQQ